MMPVPDACATLRFSTEGMPEERRAQAVRELHLHERTILFARLEPIEPLDPLPSFADRNISSVAFDVGFGDLSYFNRTFRRRYAATPTDIKQSSMRTDPPRR
jgi:AraC-like DNA-binding protein